MFLLGSASEGIASRSMMSGETRSPGNSFFLLCNIIAEQIGEICTEMCRWERRSQHDKIILLVSRSREQDAFWDFLKPKYKWIEPHEKWELLLSLYSYLVLFFGFPSIKHKASQFTARGYLIRQNNSIDLKIEASQLLFDQSISLSLCPCLFYFPHPRTLPS